MKNADEFERNYQEKTEKAGMRNLNFRSIRHSDRHQINRAYKSELEEQGDRYCSTFEGKKDDENSYDSDCFQGMEQEKSDSSDHKLKLIHHYDIFDNFTVNKVVLVLVTHSIGH